MRLHEENDQNAIHINQNAVINYSEFFFVKSFSGYLSVVLKTNSFTIIDRHRQGDPSLCILIP